MVVPVPGADCHEARVPPMAARHCKTVTCALQRVRPENDTARPPTLDMQVLGRTTRREAGRETNGPRLFPSEADRAGESDPEEDLVTAGARPDHDPHPASAG